VDFQDPPKSEKVARNPNNFNILKGGKVDPRSKLYQRSVAGREQLKDYLSRLSNSGADEADVFMAGVKSLMNRGHGYVGAYLDSKNPGRRYEKNQAMAITDKVMTDEGIGEHPGARLTKPKVTDEEGNIDKEATKEARDKRKEANAGRGSGPQQAPGPSAKPVGQQRKEGKRESTGQALEDSRREGIGDVAKGPASEWQNTLESRMKGEASTQDVLSAFQKQYQSQIGGKKKAAPGEGAPGPSQAPGSAAQPPAEEAVTPEEETEETGKPSADEVTISSKFKELVEGNIKSNLPSTDKNALEGSIQEAIEILEDEYDVDPEVARAAIFRRFNNKLIGGRKIVFDPSSAPERPGQKESAPEPKAAAPTAAPEAETPSAAPEAKTPQPGQQEAAAPQGGGQEAQAPASAAPKKPKGGLNIPKQPARRGGGGFTPEIGKQAIDTIRQAASEGKSVEEIVEQFNQGNLFPGGLVTDTAQTNPLEGGSTPASPASPKAPQTQEERGGSLLDEQGQAKDFRKSGPQPTGGGGSRQLPLPLGRDNSAAKLKGRADVEKRRLAKQEKSLGKPSPRPRKSGKSPVQPELFTKSGNPRQFNTGEGGNMSYDEFSQSVRSMMR
jgi:hypothetical protein